MVDPNSFEEIPENIKEFYNSVSKSMLNQIRKRGIRNFSGIHVNRWLRLNFSINENELIIEKHKLAASQVGKYLLRKTSDYKIPLSEVRTLLEVDQQLQQHQTLENEKFSKLKAEVELLRENKRKLRQPRSKVSVKASKPITKLSTPSIGAKHQTELLTTLDYDSIYKPWMTHVETKSTSKSYWYIHEYIGRYILNFAIKNNATSINYEIVQSFLDDYGKGKAAKTMNHYNRVAKYFLEFCLEL
ncbi:MAG: hypothetical protein GPJ54_18480 [Candidatus Heimdallarchaeota archaeon]|nr:hypothetical protein [Candidatus Heimdallarchaeota archaeon]